MEISFRAKMVLQLLKCLDEMQLETAMLMLVGTLLFPFVIGSLWSLAITVICQMFWLGIYAAALVALVSSGFLAFLVVTRNVSFVPKVAGFSESGKQKILPCSFLDVMLSLLFQAGIRFPKFIWDWIAKPGAVSQPIQVRSSKALTRLPSPILRTDGAARDRTENHRVQFVDMSDADLQNAEFIGGPEEINSPAICQPKSPLSRRRSSRNKATNK